MRSEFLALVLLLCFLPGLVNAEPRVDPETGRIRLLHIGKAWGQSNAPGPAFMQDPKIEWTPVPAHAWSMGKEALRNLRLYLPRSQQHFLDSYDVVGIDGMQSLDLRETFQRWLVDGVETGGMNFVMADDSSSFGTSGSHPSWYIVPIGDILPVMDEPVGGSPYGPEHAFHVVPQIPGHEFTRNVPWNEVWMAAANRPWPKTGSTVVTRMSGEIAINRNQVQMVYWDYPTGGGRSVAWIHRWVGNREFWRWKYSNDIAAHVIYYTSRVPIPEDLTLIHSIRGLLGDYYFDKIYVISTMEFADNFGANIRPLEMKLDELDDKKSNADQLWIDQEYEEAGVALQEALEGLEELIRDAIRAKDRAMLWIFVIEWLVVTGTSMIAGALLWTLMVKRKLYREVGETKLKMTDE